MSRNLRIGLIVPSSNVTMETEIPLLFRKGEPASASFSFHSSRMVMRRVTPEELQRMDGDSERCVRELSDARCAAYVYACLVAVMAAGKRYHIAVERRLERVVAESGVAAPVVTSAGALVSGIKALGATRVALVAPYVRALTQLVVDYLADCGVEVVDSISLEVADNHRVGELDPLRLPELAERLDCRRAEAVVLSACVQMPSLAAIDTVERRLGVPALSAATATAREVLRRLDLPLEIPNSGRLLAAREPVLEPRTA